MFEKVNPAHPDKVADRIAGAIVDLAYKKSADPKIAVEVLIGHYECNIVLETSESFHTYELENIVRRIAGSTIVTYINATPQDWQLAENQKDKIRCGDNGIFKGVPVTEEEKQLTAIAKSIYAAAGSDGKYIIHDGKLTICQSCVETATMRELYPDAVINPIGGWLGGVNVDAGATNRKLGSDMAGSVTGGGLHGKDLSKADVSVNIYAWFLAQKTGRPVEISCAIGDETVNGKPYSEIVEFARKYIQSIGGFEKFAEWGLIR